MGRARLVINENRSVLWVGADSEKFAFNTKRVERFKLYAVIHTLVKSLPVQVKIAKRNRNIKAPKKRYDETIVTFKDYYVYIRSNDMEDS